MQQLEQPVSIQASAGNDFPALTQVDPASEVDEQDLADSPKGSAVVQQSESNRKLSSEEDVPLRQHKSTLLPTNQLPVSPDSRQDSDGIASSKQTIASLPLLTNPTLTAAVPLLTNPTPTAAVDIGNKTSPTQVDSIFIADESEDGSKLDHLDKVDDPELPLPVAASPPSEEETNPVKSAIRFKFRHPSIPNHEDADAAELCSSYEVAGGRTLAT